MVDTTGISVWTVVIDAVPSALWPRLVGLLNSAERERAERFIFERDRRAYQVGHALKRLMLSAHAGAVVEPQDWAFEFGRHGKPRVARGQALNSIYRTATGWSHALSANAQSSGSTWKIWTGRPLSRSCPYVLPRLRSVGCAVYQRERGKRPSSDCGL